MDRSEGVTTRAAQRHAPVNAQALRPRQRRGTATSSCGSPTTPVELLVGDGEPLLTNAAGAPGANPSSASRVRTHVTGRTPGGSHGSRPHRPRRSPRRLPSPDHRHGTVALTPPHEAASTAQRNLDSVVVQRGQETAQTGLFRKRNKLTFTTTGTRRSGPRPDSYRTTPLKVVTSPSLNQESIPPKSGSPSAPDGRPIQMRALVPPNLASKAPAEMRVRPFSPGRVASGNSRGRANRGGIPVRRRHTSHPDRCWSTKLSTGLTCSRFMAPACASVPFTTPHQTRACDHLLDGWGTRGAHRVLRCRGRRATGVAVPHLRRYNQPPPWARLYLDCEFTVDQVRVAPRSRGATPLLVLNMLAVTAVTRRFDCDGCRVRRRTSFASRTGGRTHDWRCLVDESVDDGVVVLPCPRSAPPGRRTGPTSHHFVSPARRTAPDFGGSVRETSVRHP